MNLAQSCGWRLAARLIGPIVALALSGCGDDFATFSDVAPLSGGSAGSTGTGGVGNAGGGAGTGSAAQAAGAQANVTPAAGTGAGGSTAGADSNLEGGGTGSVPVGDGAAGAAGQPTAMPSEAYELIDDVEGAFPHLPLRDGRNGGWFAVHDETYGNMTAPSAVMLEPARGTSLFAAGFHGGGFTDWGAQLGVALKSPATGYDASEYCGLRFFAKGSGEGWTLLVSDRLSVPEGGVCVQGSFDAARDCYNFVGKSFGVGSDWQEVKIRFDELRLRQDPGNARRLDASALYDIVFNFYAADGAPFQLLIDDLSFINNTSADCQ